MKIIVTGCYGFIGFNFINYLLKNYSNDIFIVGIDSLETNCSKLNAKNIQTNDNFLFIKEDICKILDIGYDFSDFDATVNFAAESHVDNSIRSPEKFINSNILGTLKVFQNSLENDIENNIHISTDEVYGSAKEHFFSEKEILNPSSPYSASKASAEMICKSLQKTYGLNLNIVRPANNYGIFQQPEKLIPFSILSLISNNNIEIYGDGKNIRHWVHVEDTCSAIFKIMSGSYENEIFNIGSGEYMNNLDLANQILKYFDYEEDRISFVSDRPGHDFRYAIDISKIQATGWKPAHKIDESLRDVISWYESNQDWWLDEYKTTIKNRLSRFKISN